MERHIGDVYYVPGFLLTELKKIHSDIKTNRLTIKSIDTSKAVTFYRFKETKYIGTDMILNMCVFKERSEKDV